MRFYHFTYVFRVEWHSLIVWNRHDIWPFSESNGIQTHKHFVNKHLIIQPCWPVFLCDCLKISSQIYLFIADTSYFLWKNENKLFSNFQMLLFNALLYFSTPLLTLLYLVSYQEFHKFLVLRVSQKFLRGLGRRTVQNTPTLQNVLPVKLPRNFYIADTWL